MGFGEQLRSAIERLKTSSVDKETIKEVTKELQRALIAADVEIQLVLDLSKRIENEAFKELPDGINRREHLIKTTYDALAELLGSEQAKAPERPKRILLTGLFGQGKCVHPDTVVPLKNGTITRIEQLYLKQEEEEFQLEDGFVKELQNPIGIFSFDPLTLKIVGGKATHVWKLKKTAPLIKVQLDNGNNHSVTVTPEHPFFVLENSEIKKVTATELKLGQFVATPKKLLFESNSKEFERAFTEAIKNGWILENKTLAENAKTLIKSKFGTLKGFFDKANENYCFCTFAGYLKSGKIFGSAIKKLEEFGFEAKFEGNIKIMAARSHGRSITLPYHQTAELCEFLGYFLADGHMRKRYVEICNESIEVLERISAIGQNLFGIKPTIKKDKRRAHLSTVVFCSTNIVKLLNQALDIPINKKSDKITIPKAVLTADAKSRKAFLQAYFDCDGYIAKGERAIEFCTASKRFSDSLRALLLGFGFVPTSIKKNLGEKKYYLVRLKAKDVEVFAREIGSIIPFKKNRLAECETIGKGQTFGKNEMLHVGNKLKQVREHFGATIGEIQKHVLSYGTYESEGIISRNSLRKFLNSLNKTKNKNNFLLKSVIEPKTANQIAAALGEPVGWTNAVVYRLKEIGLVETLNGQVQITEKGKEALQQNEEVNQQTTQNLTLLSESDLTWIKVKKLETAENTEFVYDLTVEDYHNFVANQTIVHNTTTAGKLAHYYQKRGLKVGVIAADTFRPAAFEQLKQICEKIKVPLFGNPKEKSARKVVEEALKQAKDFNLLICDSAGRNALDVELVKEIKEINSAFQPEQTWLVLGADIGQVAKKQALAFHTAVGVNGVIITRIDGSAKGGGALAACKATNSPVFFVGVGEKIDDLQEFDATRFLSRIMGYGDLQALLEKAKEAYEEEPVDLEAMMSGTFTLQMFYDQLKAAKKIGPFGKIMDLMGMKQQLPKEMAEVGEEKLNNFGIIMDSMTKQEKNDPEIINSSRIARIAKGAGKTQEQVRELLSNFKRMKKAFKKLKGIDEEKLAKGGMDMQKLQQMFGKKKKFKIR